MTRKLLSPNGATLLFELGAGANLNDCVAPGIYHQASNVEASGGTNYPIGSGDTVPYAGYLEVVVDASNTFAYQRYHTYRLYNKMFYRSAQWNTPTAGVWNWSTWRQVPTSTNLVADYLNIDSGYTLTGGNPGATANGAINIEDNLKFFVNTDAATEGGYGDYDADIWMKDNGYIMAEDEIHLRPTNTGSMPSYTEQGRVVFKSKVLDTAGAINYIHTGRNFSGTTKNDLVIGEYTPDGSLDNTYWAYFDESTGGKLGLGFSGDGLTAPAVDYRLHVKDNVGTTTPVARVENTGSAYSLVDLKGSTTSTAVQIGANGNALIGRIGTSEVLTVNSSGVTVNGAVDGNIVAGGAGFVCISDVNGYLDTSSIITETELNQLNGISTSSTIQTQLDARKVPLYYMITGSNVTLFSGLTGTSTASVFGTTGTNLAVGSYLVEGAVYIESTTDLSTTGTHSIFFGSSSGTAVPSETLMYLSYNSSVTPVGNAAALSGVRRPGTTTFPSLTLTAIAAATTNVSKMQINSIVRIGTAGNFTVRYTATASGAGTINSVALPGSYLKITPISTQTATTVGTWA